MILPEQAAPSRQGIRSTWKNNKPGYWQAMYKKTMFLVYHIEEV